MHSQSKLQTNTRGNGEEHTTLTHYWSQCPARFFLLFSHCGKKEVGPMHSQSKLQTNTRGKGEEHMSRDTNHVHTHTDTKSSP